MPTDPNLPHKMDSEKSIYLDREEHVHRGEVGAKRVVLYNYDSGTDTLNPYATGLINFKYDYVAVTYPDDTTDVFTFKTGGVSGTTQGTVTITYVDNTKALMSSAALT